MNEQPATPPAKRQGKGCIFYGCLTVIVLVVVALVAVYFGVKSGVDNIVEQYTTTNSLSFAEVQLSEEEATAVQERVDEFIENLEQGEPAEPLALTGDEINALFAYDPDMSAWKERIRVSIEGDQIQGQISIPLSVFPWPIKREDRYLNGEAVLQPQLSNGKFDVKFESVTIKGEKLPQEFIAELNKQDVSQQISQEPENQELFSKFSSIRVEDGKLILVPKNLKQAESSAGGGNNESLIKE